jgi:membrane protein DedA with SNARE-associated domain
VSTGLLLLGLTVLVASSVPFVPTGELVSGAAALVAPSLLGTVGVFLVAWAASCAGDTVLFSAARWLSGPLQRWQFRHPGGARAEQARAWLDRSGVAAIVVARLVPGTRAPVIIALGASGTSHRRFVVADLVACACWSLLYTGAGALGGRVSGHPVLAVTAAVLIAVGASAVAGRLLRRRQEGRRQDDDREDAVQTS